MAWRLGALAVAYLLGAVPFGYIIVKMLVGADVRAAGSGSTGATNVVRSAGLKAGLLTYLFDVLKGLTAVLAMRAATGEPLWLGAAAVAAILGHMFPVFLGFRGGKGVATGVGAYLAIVPYAVLTTLVVWALVFWRTRIVSIASLVATLLVPVWIWVWHRFVFGTPTRADLIVAVAAGLVLIVAKHAGNISRLVTGRENRFSRGSEDAAARSERS